MMNIPMALTWARIAMIPVLVATLYLPEDMLTSRLAQVVAAGIFVMCAITDWLDGYLARTMRQTSAFGAFLDPVADKLLVCTTLIVLVHMGRLHSIVCVLIIGREIAVSALREWMAQVGKSKSVSVANLGKIKTACQMVAIPFLLLDFKVSGTLTTVHIGTPLIWAAAFLTVWSMLAYIKAAYLAHAVSAPSQGPSNLIDIRAKTIPVGRKIA
jgi:CDP-diacylglycerol--glycerol-3-phosphate 3-phosphatidyltransferase